MVYPTLLALAVPVSVTCKVNAMGGTTVTAVTADSDAAPFKEFTFDDYNVDTQGYDGIASRIESALAGQVNQALKETS